MGYQQSELWKLFETRTKSDTQFKDAVKKLCDTGETLSATISRFFPTFTRHDYKHIEGVCKWMMQLLGDQAEKLTAAEAALLLLAACWHDSGLSVDEKEEEILRKQMQNLSPDWQDFFAKHFEEMKPDADNVSEMNRICRIFVRERHHLRAKQKLRDNEWDPALTKNHITLELVADLCKSHGEDLKFDTRAFNADADFNMCAILLRLADLLDIDEIRAPEVWFRYMGLDKPATAEEAESSKQFQENKAGSFSLDASRDRLKFNADCTDPDVDEGIVSYLELCRKELDNCARIQKKCQKEHWRNLRLPFEISSEISSHGYTRGNFRLTMDQERIVELLAGENLYSNPGVFVRELLQNAIDAVLYRAEVDNSFTLDQGRIDIYTWLDEEGYAWFRIEDNGTGMDQHIIEHYLLKVGRSYYTSNEFHHEQRSARNRTGFRPTSRFGIGILSCFLSDRERNQLEVETRRYKHDSQPLRLFVPKLKGAYYLIKPDTTPVVEGGYGKSSLKELHAPLNAEVTKRFETYDVGTTFCVRVSQFRMGGRTFRELLDQYIVYPEVRVVHHDLDGGSEKEYLLQSELMALAEAVIGAGKEKEVKEFPLPDCFYDKLKTAMPDWNWTVENRPQLIFSYQRLDTLSSNTAGVRVWLRVRTGAKCRKKLIIEGKETIPSIEGSFRFDGKDFIVRFNLKKYIFSIANQAVSRSRLQGLEWKAHLSEEDFDLGANEKKLLKLAITKEDVHLLAYNGVLASVSHYGTNHDDGAVLLLRCSNHPEVDMAREEIRSFPLETACELALLNVLSLFQAGREPWRYHSESEYRAILQQHPAWYGKLQFHLKDSADVTEMPESYKDGQYFDYKALFSSLYSSALMDAISMTALKEQYAVGVAQDETKWYVTISALTNDCAAEDLTAFPPLLFLSDRQQGRRNPGILCVGRLYNPEHPFSKWLIGHRAQLQETVPELYQTILRAMPESRNRKNTINKTLQALRRMKGVSFGIPEDLELTDEDFDESKWENE